MARLFTAVELGPVACGAITACQSELAKSLRDAGDSGLRLVRPGQLHLTLVFLGEVEQSRVSSVTDAMTPTIPVHAFDLELAECGVFPRQGRARVLWLGAGRGARELRQVFDIVSGRLEAVGIPRERRSFAPHLTIGRWREGGEPGVRHRLPQIGFVTAERVSAVTLFESRLHSSGAEHIALVRAPLAAASSSLH